MTPELDQKIGEAADYLENLICAFGPEEGLTLDKETWHRVRLAIIKVLPSVRMRNASDR